MPPFPFGGWAWGRSPWGGKRGVWGAAAHQDHPSRGVWGAGAPQGPRGVGDGVGDQLPPQDFSVFYPVSLSRVALG